MTPALLLLLSPSLPAASQAKPAERYQAKLTSGGVERDYIVRVPAGAGPKPLVVVLHGYTGSGSLAEIYTRMGPQAERRGYIGVYPDGLGDPKGWNVGFMDLSGRGQDDAKFVMQLVDAVSAKTSVDPKRIYICGHSNGAFLTHVVAAKYGNRIAAAAAVAGTIGLRRPQIPSPKAPVPMLIIHGMKDPTVGFSTNSDALLKSYGARDTATWWATQNGIKTPPKETKPDAEHEWLSEWRGTSPRQEVSLLSLPTAYHEWPGGLTRSGPETRSGADATKTILDFFDRQRLD
jgi:polyhydroxybutyrate depolymerase